MKASTAIATCFCQTYATNGVPCLQCIGNAPSLLGLNSTTLFMSLGSACAAGDSTYVVLLTRWHPPQSPHQFDVRSHSQKTDLIVILRYAAAAALIDPVVHDAVIANVVSATTSAGAASSAGAKPTTTGAAAVVPSAVRSTTSNAASKQAVTVLSAVAGVLVALF
ncbi:hypothetical protein BC830DRAFT_370662 [Chytriomyces sp. MP71]|nr:hypothetical protein BC830DRAFT_370662 [Chytriomyces sp. MP71]